MFITCQQCSTIFRLDESLLKPTGSKVRCSQCGNVFVEYPPTLEIDEPAVTEPAMDEPAVDEPVVDEPVVDEPVLDEPVLDEPVLDEPAVAGLAETQVASEAPADDVFDQQLEGMDLDELDAIFEQGEEEAASVEEEDLVAPEASPEADDTAAFDEADLDMDFDLDAESEPGQASVDAPTTADAADDDLGDLDLDLDFEIDAEAPVEDSDSAALAPSGEEDDLDLDLENLDFSLDGDAGDIEETAVDPDVAGEDDDLLDGLDEIDGLGEASPETAPAEASSEDEDAMALDIDEDLEATAAVADDQGDDFDLTELDDMLGGDDASGKVSAGVNREAVDEDAELALDEIGGDEGAAVSTPASDADSIETESEGLDLSDLDAMLDEVDGQTDEAGEELELELDDGALALDDDATAAPDADDDLEDLDFELDAEFEDKPVAQVGAEDAANDTHDEEIDLSDIEQMLEGDDAALDTQQLEADFLGLDDEQMSEKGATPELDLDDTDEIDLDDIEAAIDEAEGELDDDTLGMGEPQEQELTLDDSSSDDSLSMELNDDIVLELDSDDSEPVAEEDEDLDLSDLNLDEDQESIDENEVMDAGDIELEFEVEEDGSGLDIADEPAVSEAKEEAAEDFAIEDTVPAPQADKVERKSPPKPKKAKRSSSKVLVLILILLLLGGAGYLYFAVVYQGMNIPYVSQLLKQEPKDPAGILKLKTLDINSKFVDTENSGRLFVIEGKVRNGYSVNRQMIRLQGKLYTKGKILAKSEFAYAGVKIADEALISLPVAELKKKLNSGISQGAATKVNPGGSIAFMIIFSELPGPDELDEFAIEVISSMASK